MNSSAKGGSALAPSQAEIVSVPLGVVATGAEAPTREIARRLAEAMLGVAAKCRPVLSAPASDRELSCVFFRQVAAGVFARLLQNDGYRQSLLIPIFDDLTHSVREAGQATPEAVRDENIKTRAETAQQYAVIQAQLHALAVIPTTPDGEGLPVAVAEEIAIAFGARKGGSRSTSLPCLWKRSASSTGRSRLNCVASTMPTRRVARSASDAAGFP